MASALNAITGREATLQWWGQFESLCNDGEGFAQDLRVSWRDVGDEAGEDEEVLGRPIAPDELDDFVEYLAEYGM